MCKSEKRRVVSPPFCFIGKMRKLRLMKWALFTLISVLIFPVCSLGQNTTAPKFNQYLVKVDTIKPKAPNLKSHRDARLFRTNLREAAKEGINFSGHFVLSYWGCGASCMTVAIMDSRNGRVFFPTEISGLSLQDWENDFKYSSESKLLAISVYENGVLLGIDYFEWTGARLRKITFVSKPAGN